MVLLVSVLSIASCCMWTSEGRTEGMTYTSECQNTRDWCHRSIAGRTRRDNLRESSNQHQMSIPTAGKSHLMCLIKLLQRNRVIKPSLASMSARATHTVIVSILTRGASPQSTIFAQLRKAFSRVYGSHALEMFSWIHP